MNGEEIRELAAVYALGGLDGDDRARFEALLRTGNQEATAALSEFEATLVDLGTESRTVPPPAVKVAVMDRIAATLPLSSVPSRPTARTPRRAWWPLAWTAAMAAGIAGVAVGLWMSGTYQHRLESLTREATGLKTELGRQQAELARQREIVALLRDPASQVVSLSGLEPAPSARARVIWNPPSGGLLVAAGLPAAPEGKTYQLWAIAGKNVPVSAGVFNVDPQGAGSLRVAPLPGVDKVDLFAVTLEPAGGLPAPTGQMYLAGKS